MKSNGEGAATWVTWLVSALQVTRGRSSMDITELNAAGLVVAATAGLLSFVSPCVLPLLPAYVGYIVGESALDSAESSLSRRAALGKAMAFVFGLATVFTLLGASASLLGELLLDYRGPVSKIAGVLIIAFGLHLTGLLPIPTLYSESRVDFLAARGVRFAGPYLMGAAFAIGWTPCVGPVLGSIFLLASQSQTVFEGSLLLFVYALGLGLPFVVAALALRQTWLFVSWFKRHARLVSLASGSLLILVGVLVFTGRFTLLTTWLIGIFGTGLTI